MEALSFFVLVPGFFAAVQLLLCRRRLPRPAKFFPLALVLTVGLVCLGGAVRVLPLPNTFFFDRHSFLAFPDYFYVGLFCFPALVGLGIGGILSVSIHKSAEEEQT